MAFQPADVTFGRHESFPLRFGWLAKGLFALRDDPSVFSRADATVRLGVGRNMVTSIRHWLQATGLIRPLTRKSQFEETWLARIAFGTEGDPYLEDDATIWLLHWLLSTNPSGATAIYWFFNHFHKTTFSNDEVAAALRNFVDRETTSRTSSTTLNRDATMLLRMYTPTKASTRLALEDALDSPLANLGLIDRIDGHQRRAFPRKRSDLPLTVFTFAITEVFHHTQASQLAIRDLMYSDANRCAPGAVFRMTEEGIVQKIEDLCAATGDFRLDQTAGVSQLYRMRLPDSQSILERYYSNGRSKAAA